MGGSRCYLVLSTTTEKRKALRASCWRLVSFWRKEVGRRSCGLAAVESVKALGTKNALQCADATRFAWAVEARARLQRVVSSESALRGLGDSPGCKGLALLLVVVECVVAAKTNDEVGKTEWLNMGSRVAATHAHGAVFWVHARQACSIIQTRQTRPGTLKPWQCWSQSIKASLRPIWPERLGARHAPPTRQQTTSTILCTKPAAGSTLSDEAKTAQRNVKYKQGVYCDANAVSYDSRSAHDADTRCQRPCNKHNIDRYADNDRNPEGAEHRGDDEREERVADNGDGLEEGAGHGVSMHPCQCVRGVYEHVASE